MAVDPAILLRCGRDPLDVIDAARAGSTDAHIDACPHCQAAIAADHQHRQAAEEFRSAASPAPDTLLPSVMATVWTELRPGRQIPVATAGASFVTQLAINTLLQHQLDELPDLEIQLCQIQLGADDPVPETIEPAALQPPLTVEITAAAAYRADLHVLADLIRHRIQQTLSTQFRLSPRSVDVSFVDLLDTPSTP
ncbi:MAG: hypothetical protein M3Y77_16785 [Actinomycetota bacterium]|nr:hypothetical protein [Actinomycetota bacterium]